MRLPWPALLGGVLVAAIGTAGLIRGAVPQPAGTALATPGAVTVVGAYVRAPVPPTQVAAAYFTVHNTTSSADRLLGVTSGAGATAVLHVESGAGAMSAMGGSGVVIPAHGSLILSTGHGHVMIEHLFGRLAAGDSVDLELQFRDAGAIDVVAPVIAVGAVAPAAAAPGAQSISSTSAGQPAPTHTGVHP